MLHLPSSQNHEMKFMSSVFEDTRHIEQFAPENVSELSKNKRFGIEILALQTNTPNGQNFIFMPEAMPMVAAGYQLRKPLLINHVKSGKELGVGHTLDAVYDESSGNLIVLSYISRGKTTPNGPFGDTDELIEAIEDGFVRDASAAGLVKKQRCSICKKDGPNDPWAWLFGFGNDPEDDSCKHIRGREYKIKDTAGVIKEVVAIAEILEFEPWELSLAWAGADDNSRIVNRDVEVNMFSNNPNDFINNLTEEQIVQFTNQRRTFSLPNNPEVEGDPSMSVETLQAEKTALEAQVSAKDTEIAALKQTNAALEASVTQKDTEIADLKAEKVKNEQAIADGEFAREKAIDACVEAFAKTEPDTPEAELKPKEDAERKSIETLSLEQISARAEGYESYAKKMYPNGRSTSDEGGEAPTNKRRRVTKGGRALK